MITFIQCLLSSIPCKIGKHVYQLTDTHQLAIQAYSSTDDGMTTLLINNLSFSKLYELACNITDQECQIMTINYALNKKVK
jgi:hypothetical protein